jgi:hypothetical protein
MAVQLILQRLQVILATTLAATLRTMAVRTLEATMVVAMTCPAATTTKWKKVKR